MLLNLLLNLLPCVIKIVFSANLFITEGSRPRTQKGLWKIIFSPLLLRPKFLIQVLQFLNQISIPGHSFHANKGVGKSDSPVTDSVGPPRGPGPGPLYHSTTASSSHSSCRGASCTEGCQSLPRLATFQLPGAAQHQLWLPGMPPDTASSCSMTTTPFMMGDQEIRHTS